MCWASVRVVVSCRQAGRRERHRRPVSSLLPPWVGTFSVLKNTTIAAFAIHIRRDRVLASESVPGTVPRHDRTGTETRVSVSTTWTTGASFAALIVIFAVSLAVENAVVPPPAPD